MEETLNFIKKCLKDNKVLWTYHVNMRLAERHIEREIILNSVDSFEVIEANPEDKYLPSYLLYGSLGNIIFHVLVAVDRMKENIRIITAYNPDINEWEKDFKARRKSK